MGPTERHDRGKLEPLSDRTRLGQQLMHDDARHVREAGRSRLAPTS